jgi:hypothetical protein
MRDGMQLVHDPIYLLFETRRDMDCYVCAQAGRSTRAVAICQNCGVAMCMAHLAEQQANSPSGAGIGCPHQMPVPGKT